nr:MFS transporter [Sansalvadorimonas sp. 2012CJ34-2]
MEVYDFMIYALMAPYIGVLFFPVADSDSSLLLTFAAFAVGYVSRPLGGIVFGHQGDRHGRKLPFTMTILVMALSTFLIGCLPTWQQVGNMAPFLLVTLRLLQGVSMGGETGGALTYISEHEPRRQGVAVSAIVSGMFFGVLLGYIVHGLLVMVLGQDGIMQGGWRLVFWLGAVLGVIGYRMRSRFQETAIFCQVQEARQTATVPLLEVFQNYKLHLFCGVISLAIYSVTMLLLMVYLPSWMQMNQPGSGVAFLGAMSAALMVLTVLAFGLLYDRIGAEKMIWIASLNNLLFGGVWYYLFISTPAFVWHLLPFASVFVSLMAAAQIPMLAGLFPSRVRYTGLALSYNIGFMLGGTTPLVSVWLNQVTEKAWTPGLLLVISGLAGLMLLKPLARIWRTAPCHSPSKLTAKAQSKT